MEYRVVDADTHTVEPPEMWRRFLPAKYRDQAPTLVKDPRGGDAWKFGPDAPARPIGMVSTPGKAYEEMHWLGATYDSIRKGLSSSGSIYGYAPASVPMPHPNAYD